MLSGGSWLVVAFAAVLFSVCIIQSSAYEDQGIACNSCGEECTQSCGTRHFRTCCFNYLRKRSGPADATAAPIDSPTASSVHPNGYLYTNIAAVDDERRRDAERNYREQQLSQAWLFLLNVNRFLLRKFSQFVLDQSTQSLRYYNNAIGSNGGGQQHTFEEAMLHEV